MTEKFDFQDGNGPVPAHRHVNGRGWVADTARVYDKAWVSDDARVYGKALVHGQAGVYGKAWVYGDARVYGKTWVYGVMRSDGHCFTAVRCADGKKRVIAGCRYFTLAEAREHWARTRGGTKLGNETMAILDYFVATEQL